jgi:hypothetical protein
MYTGSGRVYRTTPYVLHDRRHGASSTGVRDLERLLTGWEWGESSQVYIRTWSAFGLPQCGSVPQKLYKILVQSRVKKIQSTCKIIFKISLFFGFLNAGYFNMFQMIKKIVIFLEVQPCPSPPSDPTLRHLP